MTLGGEIVIMPRPDLAEFLSLIEQHRVTHSRLLGQANHDSR